jgi:hypothetical protein
MTMKAVRLGPVTENQYPVEYTCGWCCSFVSSTFGGEASRGDVRGPAGILRVCPNCGRPSYRDLDERWTPATLYGDAVGDLPDDVAPLYAEARLCVAVGADHAAVMVGRKILMHVAVEKGAAENQNFVSYVDYLVANNLVPPGTREWVDEIRQVGNDANHDIGRITVPEARAVVDFVGMLLKLVYEFPAKGSASVAARAARDAAVDVATAPTNAEPGTPAPPVLGS